MKEMTTELVFIIDRSGSMHGLEKDTIGGYNSMLQKERAKAGRAYVTTILFSDTYSVLHDRIDIQDIEPMTEKEYEAGGLTALYDAIGRTIEHIEQRKGKPDHTVFAITTDGLENASRKYSGKDIRKMIDRGKERGWNFIFLGSDPGSEEEASDIGIDRFCCYESTPYGARTRFENISSYISEIQDDGN